MFYLVRIVGGTITDVGFDEDEKEYARLAQWLPISQICNMKLVCNLDISDKILNLALKASHHKSAK